MFIGQRRECGIGSDRVVDLDVMSPERNLFAMPSSIIRGWVICEMPGSTERHITDIETIRATLTRQCELHHTNGNMLETVSKLGVV